ncbi:MAG: hypothetical protein MUF57_00585, partial [Gammaproteobacteria bacterium]|nr:hypothetical protein [Gammaproteobacteria bacterium]
MRLGLIAPQLTLMRGRSRGGHPADLVEHLQQPGAAADHLAKLAVAADLFLQIGVLGRQPLLEPLDLGERGAQLSLLLLSLADVLKGDH